MNYPMASPYFISYQLLNLVSDFISYFYRYKLYAVSVEVVKFKFSLLLLIFHLNQWLKTQKKLIFMCS